MSRGTDFGNNTAGKHCFGHACRIHRLLSIVCVVWVASCSSWVWATTKAIDQSAGMQAVGGGLFIMYGMMDADLCARSAGTAPRGFLLIKNACKEALLAFSLALGANTGSDRTSSTADEQRPETYLGGMTASGTRMEIDEKDKSKCSDLAIKTCQRMAQMARTKKVGECGCELEKPPIDPKTGEVTNELLKKMTPPEFQQQIKKAITTGDFSKVIDKAETEKMAKRSFEKMSQDLDKAIVNLKKEGRSISDVGSAIGLGVNQTQSAAPEIGSETQEEDVTADAAQEAELKPSPTKMVAVKGTSKKKKPQEPPEDWDSQTEQRRRQWRRVAQKRSTGIIDNERRALFVAVELRYDALEEDELDTKYFEVQKGQRTGVKGASGVVSDTTDNDAQPKGLK